MSFDSILAIMSGLAGSIGVLSFARQIVESIRSAEKSQIRITAAEKLANEKPERSKYAWDLARITLESYFNKNLAQVTAIFWLSVFVMIFGFFIIVWGITQALSQPNSTLPTVITGLAGVITEFIGASFLFIYRSTMEQAINYTKTLERINSVGMAMQILDTIPDDAKVDDLKNITKATVVKTLMQRAYEIDNKTETDQQD